MPTILICVISNCGIFRTSKLDDGNAIRMRRVRSRICSVNKVLYCELQGIQLCNINVAATEIRFFYSLPVLAYSTILPSSINVSHRSICVGPAGTIEQIKTLCGAINRIQIFKIALVADLDEAVTFFICPTIKPVPRCIVHRAGNVEHQRDIDRLGDDLRLTLAGDVGLKRQISGFRIILLICFDAAGRAVVLRRACCNRYHGQNHNNSQQKR